VRKDKVLKCLYYWYYAGDLTGGEDGVSLHRRSLNRVPRFNAATVEKAQERRNVKERGKAQGKKAKTGMKKKHEQGGRNFLGSKERGRGIRQASGSGVGGWSKRGRDGQVKRTRKKLAGNQTCPNRGGEKFRETDLLLLRRGVPGAFLHRGKKE